jgi:hypothetical protein
MKYKLYKFIINLLYSDDKKMSICLSIDCRIEYLQKLIIENKTIDKFTTNNDINDLKEIRNLYSSKLFN